MRFTLDTVGKPHWPARWARPGAMPEGFEDLATKLGPPAHPPGRDVRCIVSVGMLTEGWDCNTVTHIVGLRPFMSQLLCEQVVGRALRGQSTILCPTDRFAEEVAQVLACRSRSCPSKRPVQAEAATTAKAHPRGAGKSAIRHDGAPRAWVFDRHPQPRYDGLAYRRAPDPRSCGHSAGSPIWRRCCAKGRPGALTPGGLTRVDLNAFHRGHRVQQLCFRMATELTRHYVQQGKKAKRPPMCCSRSCWAIVQRYVAGEGAATAARRSAPTPSCRRPNPTFATGRPEPPKPLNFRG